MDAAIEKKSIMGDLLAEHVLLWYLTREARELCESYLKTGRMDPKVFIELCGSFQALEMNDRTFLTLKSEEELGDDSYTVVAQFWESVRGRVLNGESVDKAFDEAKIEDLEPDDAAADLTR